MMGFSEVNALVHEMEDLVRTAEPLGFALAPASVDALLVCADATAVLSGSAPGERPDVARLTLWLQQATGVGRSRLGLESAAPSAPAAPVVAEAEPGDVLVVPAGLEHRFTDVRGAGAGAGAGDGEPFRVVVAFGPAEGTRHP